jgi:hypothetical protein
MQHGMAATFEVFVALLQAADETDRGSRDVLRLGARHACAGLRIFTRRFPIGAPPLYLWEGTLSWIGGQRRRALRLWQRAIERAGELQMPYERGRAHLEVARNGAVSRDLQREHLQRAEEIFERLGCSYELAQVRMLLGVSA